MHVFCVYDLSCVRSICFGAHVYSNRLVEVAIECEFHCVKRTKDNP